MREVLVKSPHHLFGDGEEGSYTAGVEGFEAVLGWRLRKMAVKEGEDKFFKDFGNSAEEGDGPIGLAVTSFLAWLLEGNYSSLFPDGRQLTVRNGQFKKFHQELNTTRAKILQVDRSQSVRSNGGRGFCSPGGINSVQRRKMGERVVKMKFFIRVILRVLGLEE